MSPAAAAEVAAILRLADAMEAQRITPNTAGACKGAKTCHICHVIGCATRVAFAPTQPR